MPLVNYCRKCKTEVRNGDACPRCGGRLTKAGERLSFCYKRLPVTDWFSWNAMLRVAVPVITLVLLTTLLVEGIAEGEAGVISVLTQGFFMTLLGAFGALLLLMMLLLTLQGREEIRYVLDAKGVKAGTYLTRPGTIQMYARLMTAQRPPTKQEDEPDGENGEICVRHVELPWPQIRRAQFWPETNTILLYRPRWWQVMCIRCSTAEYAEAETLIRGKMARGRKGRRIKR